MPIAEVDRDVLQRHRPRIGAGEQQEVLDDRGHVADLVVDVGERVAHRRDRLVAVTLEVLDATPDHGQRRAQLMARIGRELALAPQRNALVRQRLADRDQRPSRVDGAEPECHEDDDDAAEKQDHEHHVECPLLGDPITDDLNGICLAICRLHVLCEDAHRGLDGRLRSIRAEPLRQHGRRSDIATVRSSRSHGSHVRQAVWHTEAALTDGEEVVVPIDGQRDRACAAATEEKAVWPVVVIRRARPFSAQDRLDLVEAGIELCRGAASQ